MWSQFHTCVPHCTHVAGIVSGCYDDDFETSVAELTEDEQCRESGESGEGGESREGGEGDTACHDEPGVMMAENSSPQRDSDGEVRSECGGGRDSERDGGTVGEEDEEVEELAVSFQELSELCSSLEGTIHSGSVEEVS